jgi:hypothetical protein
MEKQLELSNITNELNKIPQGNRSTQKWKNKQRETELEERRDSLSQDINRLKSQLRQVNKK